MLIIYLIVMFLIYKYAPVVKDKINNEYEAKFNFKLLSKENSKKLLLASVIILFGGFYGGLNPRDKVSGIILILVGIGLILSKVYDVYKKTNLKYGLFAGLLYFIIVYIYLLSGIFAIMGVVLLLATLYRETHYTT